MRAGLAMRKRFEVFKHNNHQLFIALDQLCNALVSWVASLFAIIPVLPRTDKCWGDETISSCSYRLHRDGIRSWQMKLIDILFWFDKRTDSTGKVIRHCEDSYLSEKYGRQLPPELRTKEE